MFFCDVCCGRVGPLAASLRKRLLRGVLRLALCDWQLATVGDLDWRFIVEACEQVSQLVPTSSLYRDVVFRHVFQCVEVDWNFAELLFGCVGDHSKCVSHGCERESVVCPILRV